MGEARIKYGNVCEHNHDLAADISTTPVTDPLPKEPPMVAFRRLERLSSGGSYAVDQACCRVAGKGMLKPWDKFTGLGFRIVLAAPLPTKPNIPKNLLDDDPKNGDE